MRVPSRPSSRHLAAPALVALGLAQIVAPAGLEPVRAADQQQAVFRSHVELVRVDALVARGGVPVQGLTPSDFELRDEGVVQQVVGASLEQVPLDVMLVLDLSSSITSANARLLRDAALSFLAGLTPADRAGLLTFSGRVTLAQPLTPDLNRVRARIDDLQGGGSTALNDAIYTALRFREPNDSRGAVVVFSDGIDNTSWLSGDEVIETGRRSDAIVHAVVADLPGAGLRASDNAVLHTLGRETGGQVWEANWGPLLTTAFQAVLKDLRSRYVLTYYPTGVSAAGWHQLDVKLKRGGGKVTARAGYFRTAAGQ